MSIEENRIKMKINQNSGIPNMLGQDLENPFERGSSTFKFDSELELD